MSRSSYGAALAALTLGAAVMGSDPAFAGRSAARSMPEIAACEDVRSVPGTGCRSAAELVLDEFRGGTAAGAVRALGAPERTRPHSGGFRVLVWDRSGIEMAEGGRVIRREECQLLMAVTRSGIVSDAVLTSDSRSCSRRFLVRKQ
jgi:hypothetical protein